MATQKFPVPTIQQIYPAPIIYEADWVYVDSGTGNDLTGNGTMGNPWATIQRAIDSFNNIQSREYKIRATGTFTDITIDVSKLTPVRAFNTDDSDGFPSSNIMACELLIQETTQSLGSLLFDFTRIAGSVSQGQDSQSNAPNPFIIGSSPNLGVKIEYGTFQIFGDSIMLKNQVLSISDSELTEENGANTDVFFFMTDSRLKIQDTCLYRNGASTDMEDLFEGNSNLIWLSNVDLDIYGLSDGGAFNKAYIDDDVFSSATSTWISFANKNELIYTGFDERQQDYFNPTNGFNTFSTATTHQNNTYFSQSYPYVGVTNNNDVHGTINSGSLQPPPYTPLRQVFLHYSVEIPVNTIHVIRFPQFTRTALIDYYCYELNTGIAERAYRLFNEYVLYSDSKFAYTGGPGDQRVNFGGQNVIGGWVTNFLFGGVEPTHNSGNDNSNQMDYHKYNAGNGLCGIALDNFYVNPIIVQIEIKCAIDDS